MLRTMVLCLGSSKMEGGPSEAPPRPETSLKNCSSSWMRPTSPTSSMKTARSARTAQVARTGGERCADGGADGEGGSAGELEQLGVWRLELEL